MRRSPPPDGPLPETCIAPDRQPHGATAQHRRRHGMTLVEVLLAMAILTLGLFSLTSAASRCLAVMRTASQYHAARAILDQGSLEYPLVRYAREVFNMDVSPTTYPGGYVFERESEELEDEEKLYIVRTQVSWARRGGETTITVYDYLYWENRP